MIFDCHFALFSPAAVIGPPGVRVEALANSLHVRFLAPRIEKEHETWTMKNIYSSWVYNVEYWKNGSDTKVSGAGSLLSARCGSEARMMGGGGAGGPSSQGLTRRQHPKVQRT